MKSDATLQKEIIAELSWEPTINAERIGVEVQDGIVTLAGQVDNFAEKWHAESATRRVTGVKALVIAIEVNLPGNCIRSDIDIARSAENALEFSILLAKESVKVMLENGWITLTGEVDWAYQRDIAAETVRYLPGVTGLSNQIVIAPKVSLSAVKSDIEAALKRRATSDAQKIVVDVHGAEVTLTGVVHSWAERDLAKQSAWSTPGVKNVIDNIRFIY